MPKTGPLQGGDDIGENVYVAMKAWHRERRIIRKRNCVRSPVEDWENSLFSFVRLLESPLVWSWRTLICFRRGILSRHVRRPAPERSHARSSLAPAMNANAATGLARLPPDLEIDQSEAVLLPALFAVNSITWPALNCSPSRPGMRVSMRCCRGVWQGTFIEWCILLK